MALKVSIIIANLIVLNEVHALVYLPYKRFDINVYSMLKFLIPRFSHFQVLFIHFLNLINYIF